MALETIAASVLGAVGSKLVFYPLDTIRTLQQTSTNSSYLLPLSHYWRGMGPAVVLSAPAFTVYMVAYRESKRMLAPRFGEASVLTYVLSGSISQLTSSFLWTPMEVIKGRMQIHQDAKDRPRTMATIRQIYRDGGLRGFMRGYGMPSFFLTLSCGGLLMRKGSSLGPLEFGIASAMASTSAAVASNFLDVIKTRQQLAVSEEISRIRPDDKRGVLVVARNLIREVGFFRALFKGLHIRLLHSLPSSALAMVIVESVNPDKLPQPSSSLTILEDAA